MVDLGPVGTYCERCRAGVDHVEVTTLGDFRPRYIQARDCDTGGCGTTCPICRRGIGDVHSGACMPLIERKLTDKVYVSREDCLAVAHAP